jgi:hypothetical protein
MGRGTISEHAGPRSRETLGLAGKQRLAVDRPMRQSECRSRTRAGTWDGAFVVGHRPEMDEKQ